VACGRDHGRLQLAVASWARQPSLIPPHFEYRGPSADSIVTPTLASLLSLFLLISTKMAPSRSYRGRRLHYQNRRANNTNYYYGPGANPTPLQPTSTPLQGQQQTEEVQWGRLRPKPTLAPPSPPPLHAPRRCIGTLNWAEPHVPPPIRLEIRPPGRRLTSIKG
jgi:hypothetical protein